MNYRKPSKQRKQLISSGGIADYTKLLHDSS
ncbi:hypothetical protein PAECIP112173_01045 [Paenibacillus sp. JJ-100]|nr:hypothetical protein PAECIP112173_01045 [Paenibacillus sp. JJ-100]